MNKKKLEKWNRVITKGKKNYIIKYGIPTERPLCIKDFIIESSLSLIVYPVMGIFFGIIMFSDICNKVKKSNEIT